MTRFTDPDETVLFRLKKSRTPIVFLCVFVPIWLYFGSIFLLPYFRYLAGNMPDVKPEEALLSGLIGFLLFLAIPLFILISYAGNDLVITDRCVYVRKGLAATTLIINFKDIRSFQHAYSTGRRGSTNHRIYFYLYCGKAVKTGELYSTLTSLTALWELLRGKFEGRGFSVSELKQLGEQNPHANRPVTRRNIPLLILVASPFLLSLSAVCMYIAQL
jgi:hypothetical protein